MCYPDTDLPLLPEYTTATPPTEIIRKAWPL